LFDRVVKKKSDMASRVNYKFLVVGLLFSIGLFLTTCSPSTDFDTEPTITFKNYEKLGNDSAIRLTIGYKDGDGNLGLRKNQTEPPFDTGNRFYHNMFVRYYEKYNGEFHLTTTGPFKEDTIIYKYRFPYITPDSRNKAIEGKINTTISGIQITSPSFPERTYDGQIRFEIFIVDRDLNRSNVVSTPPIPFK
jgi:hypothetical protein